MIFDGFMIAGAIVCALSVLIGVGSAILRRYPTDASILSLAAVELFLVVYAIQAGIRQAGGEPIQGAPWEFWGYLVTALFVGVLAGWWGIGEKSRWSNIVMAAAGFTIFVMLYRMQQVWVGVGWM
jgi:hypothetical protein